MPASAAPSADLRYPIGRPDRKPALSQAERAAAIDVLAATPAGLRGAVAGLTDAQLDTPYRDGGWTVRQVVHHMADSHMNAFIRFRLAATEDNPAVKPYDEGAWARLADASMPVEPSLAIVDALHARLVHMLRATPDTDFARSVQHPENGTMTMDALLGTYAWHGRHHTAHVTGLRERSGW